MGAPSEPADAGPAHAAARKRAPGRLASQWLAMRTAMKPSMAYGRLFVGCSGVDYLLLAAGITAAIAAGVPLPLIGLLFGKMIDGFNSYSCASQGGNRMSPQQQSEFLSNVADHVEKIVIIAAINFALIWIYTSAWSALGERVVRRMREEYVSALLRQDMSYFDELGPGEITTNLSENLLAVQNGTSEKVGILISAVAYFVASYVVAFIELAPLAGQLVSLVPAFLLISLVGSQFVSRFTDRMSGHLGDAMGIADEALNNLRVVQAFESQRPLVGLYNRHLHLARRSGVYRACAAAAMLGALFFVGYSANALAFYSGSRQVTAAMARSDGDPSELVGSVYTVIFLLLDASFVIGQISPYLQTFSAAGGAGKRLFATIQRHSPIDPLDEHGAAPRLAPGDALGLRLRGVSFAYPARPDAITLHALDLDLEPGKRVGICGMSGSGKSTIVSLLMRFYDPLEGAVTLHDGTPLPALNVHWLRSQMGLVGQEPVLFDCTVLESIAHGLLSSAAHAHLHPALHFLACFSLDHDDLEAAMRTSTPEPMRAPLEEVRRLCEEAARLAHAHGFITDLPGGYFARVGAAGAQLSGGQKQRIALARAVVKQPRILVLDEATAALDSQSERAVQAAFDSVSENRTVVAIAHRLSTIKHYDKIVVMARGRVVEQGTHAELVDLKGHYAKLVDAQTHSQDADSEHAASGPSPGRAPADAAAQPAEAPPYGSTEGQIPAQGAAAASQAASARDAVAASGPVPALPEPNVGPAMHPTADEVQAFAEKAPAQPEGMPEPVEDPKMSYTRALGRLGAMAMQKWPQVVLGLAASAVIGGAYSGEAVIFGHVIQALNPCKPPSQVESRADLFALMFFVLALVELGAYIVSGTAFGFVSERLLLRIRKLVFRTLTTQRLAWYEERRQSPAGMIARLGADISNLGGLTSTVIGTIFSILVNMVAGITLAHIVAWRIAVVILATAPILLAAGYLRLKVIADFQRRHETVYARSTALAVEAAHAIRTVASLGRERDVLQLFQHSFAAPYRESMRHLVIGNVFLAISLSISYFIYGFAYWWGSKNVAEQRFSQVAFFTVLPALLFSAQSSGQLLAFAPDFTKAQVSAANIFSLLDSAESVRWKKRKQPRRKDLEETLAPAPPAPGPLPVQFERVGFTYPLRSAPALTDISLVIQPGTFAAFIGESGSGKSTTMGLIENYYEPTTGVVRVGALDTARVPTQELRRNMAIVPQEPMLFHGSVHFNVALGLDDTLTAESEARFAHREHRAPDERVVQACKDAYVHDAIMDMPDQYDTNVGPGGSHLSGGQRQRISIARALVRRPRLLLLDESTSAMDATSEQAFQRTLMHLRESRQCTILAIAHRMHTIRMADQIFLFRNGRIAARGTHDELVQVSEQYRAMISHQALDK